MAGGWLISYVALWCLVLTLALVVLAHSRLLGVLHHRFGPATAKQLADGPAIGAKIDDIAVYSLDQSLWRWPFPAPRTLVLIFISPQCETCDALMPHVKDFTRAHRDVQVALLSTLPHRGMNEAFVSYQELHSVDYLLAGSLAEEMNIQGTPYAIHVNEQGVVVAKGLVNHYEHLHSLLHSQHVEETLAEFAGTADKQKGTHEDH